MSSQKYESMPLADGEKNTPRLVRNLQKIISETPDDIPKDEPATAAKNRDKINEILRHLRGSR